MANINGITPEQIILASCIQLGEISIPIKFEEQITKPIKQIITNLYVANQLLEDDKKLAAEKAEKEEIVDDGGEPDPGTEPVDSGTVHD